MNGDRTAGIFGRALVQQVRDEAGHSLVEAVVALAILIGVLAPAGGVLAVLAANQSAADRIVALTLAEGALEEAVARRTFSDSTWSVGARPLELERRVSGDGPLLTIAVSARLASSSSPLVTLELVVLAEDR